MNRPYRIIILEDLPSDSALIQREVKKKIGSCDFLVMDNKTDFINGLILFKPDIILSDYCIPGFDWYTAFKLTLNQKPTIPFIVVSGSTNPKIVDECLNLGAMDFICKDNIKDLGPAILKTLDRTFSGLSVRLGN
jgi:DNA-binding NarL/FixJ family response regulator